MCECKPYLGLKKGGGFCRHQHILCAAMSDKISDLLHDPRFVTTPPEEEVMVTETNIESDFYYESGVHEEVTPAQKSEEAKREQERIEYRQKALETRAGFLRMADLLLDVPEKGEQPSVEEFVNEGHAFVKNCLVPQRDKLKWNTERSHIPVKKIMGNFLADQKKREKETKLKRAQQEGNEEETINPKYPVDLMWKNLIGHVPLDNYDHHEWSNVLTLEFDVLERALKKYYAEESQKEFMDAYNEAKRKWLCAYCTGYDANKMESGKNGYRFGWKTPH